MTREWQPWIDFKLPLKGEVLPIIEPPCKDCRHWHPLRNYDSQGNFDGVTLCHKEQCPDFSCFLSSDLPEEPWVTSLKKTQMAVEELERKYQVVPESKGVTVFEGRFIHLAIIPLAERSQIGVQPTERYQIEVTLGHLERETVAKELHLGDHIRDLSRVQISGRCKPAWAMVGGVCRIHRIRQVRESVRIGLPV